jgi:hypothetical protein
MISYENSIMTFSRLHIKQGRIHEKVFYQNYLNQSKVVIFQNLDNEFVNYLFLKRNYNESIFDQKDSKPQPTSESYLTFYRQNENLNKPDFI